MRVDRRPWRDHATPQSRETCSAHSLYEMSRSGWGRRICKRIGIDPFAYLRDVLARVSTHPMPVAAGRRLLRRGEAGAPLAGAVSIDRVVNAAGCD